MVTEEGHARLKLCDLDNSLIVLRLAVALEDLEQADISLKDLKAAPSFVVRFFETYRMLEFISGRKRGIDGLKVPKCGRVVRPSPQSGRAKRSTSSLG